MLFDHYKKIFLAFIFISLSIITHAEIQPELLQQLKNENVVDTTHTLTDNQIGRLKQQNEQLYQQKKIDLKILMIPSTGDLAIEQYADQVFNSIKIVHAKLDNGLLLVVAKDDRKMRLEVGYGLEGDIPDIQAARIIRHIMQPEFKNENYYQGISDAQQSIEKLSNGFVINDYGSYINHQISQTASFFFTCFELLFGVLIAWLWFFIYDRAYGDAKDRKRLAFVQSILFGIIVIFFMCLIFKLNFWSFLGLCLPTALLSAVFFAKIHTRPYFNHIVLGAIAILFSFPLIYLIFCYLFKSEAGTVSNDFIHIASPFFSVLPGILIFYIIGFIFKKIFARKKKPPHRLPDPFPNNPPKSDATSSSNSSSSSSSSSDSSSSNNRDSGGSSGGGGASGGW